jgi:hypothetical protein
VTYSPPPPPVTTTRIDREVLDEIKRRFPGQTATESLRLALAALEANAAMTPPLDATPALDEDLPDERPVIELQPPPVLTIEGDGERDQDPVQRGCPACERGSVRRGAPHTCGIPCGPVGDRDRWG